MADNTLLNAGTGGDTIATDDIGGVKYQRVKVTFGPDGVASDVALTNPLPVIITDTDRTDLRFYAVAAASGATTVETAITLTKSSGTSATTTAASFVVTSGKRFKITGQGIEKDGKKGDLLVEVTITVPETLTEAQEKAMREFAEAGGMKF